jgi:hypothetical protein
VFWFREKESLSELWECGNLAVFGRDFQGAGGKSGKPDFGFPRFPQPAISTALFLQNLGLAVAVWHYAVPGSFFFLLFFSR